MVGQKRSANNDGPVASSSKNPSKKTRFLDPSEDPANFAEEVDANLETTTRKGRVKTEGYDSDSSDDGEGVVLSRKNKSEEDEDDDMFATDDPPASEKAGDKKKKGKDFLRLGDIEGQEFEGSGESGSEESEGEPEDEDDAERRKKAGMGFELSSFNMREEMEEGKFTEDGSYIRSVDPHGVHDRWLEEVDEKAIKQARRQHRQQERMQKEKILAEEKEIQDSGGKPALERALLPLLKRGESVLEALQRLGKKTKRAEKGVKERTGTTDIERVTHLAGSIMSLGDTDVYSKTYEELVRSVRSSGIVDEAWEPPSADRKFEYKWANPQPGQATEIFGPFGEEEIRAWHQASYFGVGGEKVLLREVNVSHDWVNWEQVFD